MEGLLALGSFRSDERVALDVIAREARLPCRVVATAGEAAVWLDAHAPVALLVDIATPGAEKVFVKVRSKRPLAFMPIIAIRDEPNDLSFAEALVWGADDVVTLKSAAPLLARLTELSAAVEEQEPQGQALVAHPDRARCDVLGRVLGTAGYQVHYAVDQRAARYYVSKPETVLIVASTDLCDPKTLLEASRAARPDAALAFLSPPAKLAAHARTFASEPGVVVVPASTAPGDVLFACNARARGRSDAAEREARGAARLPYKTSVAFRGAGAAEDDVGFTYNVSALGLYVRTLAPPPGDLVWLELVPPRSDRLIRLMGSVVWSRRFGPAPSATVPPGFGVRIVDGLGDDLTIWVEACDKYEAEDAEDKSIPIASEADAWRARYPTAASELDKLAELSELAPASSAIRPDSILAVSGTASAASPADLEEADPFAATAVFTEPERSETPPVPLVVPAGPRDEIVAAEAQPVAEPAPEAEAPKGESSARDGPEAERFGDEPEPHEHAIEEDKGSDPDLESSGGHVPAGARRTKRRSGPLRVALALGLVAGLSAAVFVLASQRAETEKVGVRPAEAPEGFGLESSAPSEDPGATTPAPSAPSAGAAETPGEPAPVASGESSSAAPGEMATDWKSREDETGEAETGDNETGDIGTGDIGTGEDEAVPADAGVGVGVDAAQPNETELQTLRLDEGLLVVTSSRHADVYVHGVFVGSTNQRLRARCGPRFVRIGAPGRWLSPGQSVKIECRGLTVLKIEPSMK